jgi:outer membrane protein assembly factor BamB
VVDNVEDGYDLYQFDSSTFLQSCITGMTRLRHPREVRFAEGGGVIVGGSDNGRVYIFNARTGAKLDVIHHSTDAMVQTVAVRWTMQKDGHILMSI